MLAYPAVLDLSPSTRDLLTRLIRERRKVIGSRWRKAAPGRQALLVLVHLRKRATYTELAAGFGLGVATVYRYVTEAVDLLAGLAGCPTATLLRARPGDLLILDGTLIETDRTADRANYSGKHHRYGVNIQQLTDARGVPLWSSPGLPGSSHDLTAVRAHGLLPLFAHLSARGVVILADKGYQGIGAGVLTPYKGNNLTPPYRAANAAHAATRSIGERGFALEKHWQVLRRYRGSPHRVAKLVTAIRVLEQHQ
jgi:DDE superfamily endonuclease/Helix-turn-helix of DDE superfamily endonuclease